MKILRIIIRIFLIILLFGMFFKTDILKSDFNIDRSQFTVIDESDTHGGFLDDGLYHLTLDCSDSTEKIENQLNQWHRFPMSENLSLIMYGGEKDSINYGYNLSEQAKIPKIKNGYYCFSDRHSETTSKHSDKDLLNRSSLNFSLAIYDCDTNRLYYLRFDT